VLPKSEEFTKENRDRRDDDVSAIGEVRIPPQDRIATEERKNTTLRALTAALIDKKKELRARSLRSSENLEEESIMGRAGKSGGAVLRQDHLGRKNET